MSFTTEARSTRRKTEKTRREFLKFVRELIHRFSSPCVFSVTSESPWFPVFSFSWFEALILNSTWTVSGTLFGNLSLDQAMERILAEFAFQQIIDFFAIQSLGH